MLPLWYGCYGVVLSDGTDLRPWQSHHSTGQSCNTFAEQSSSREEYSLVSFSGSTNWSVRSATLTRLCCLQIFRSVRALHCTESHCTAFLLQQGLLSNTGTRPEDLHRTWQVSDVKSNLLPGHLPLICCGFYH